jgi:hypothetical protein
VHDFQPTKQPLRAAGVIMQSTRFLHGEENPVQFRLLIKQKWHFIQMPLFGTLKT